MSKNEWKTSRLGDLCKVSMGKTPSRGNKDFWDLDKKTSNVWVSIADLTVVQGKEIFDSKEYVSDSGAKLFKPVPKGTLLASFKLSLGKLAFAGVELRTNEAIAAFKNDESEVLNEYLYYFLTFFDWDDYAKEDHKVKGKTLNKEKVENIKIHFPTDKKEQKRIVKILDEKFGAIADLNNVIEQQITDSRELFESKLSQIFNNSENDWHSKKLNEVGFIGRGKSKHRPRNDKSLYNGVYPFIQTGDIRNAPFVIEKYTQTYNEKGLKQSKLWPKGTLCITIAANIAETSILGMDACFPDSVIGFIPENGNSAFYQYLMMFNKIELQKRGKGSAQDNINLGTFESMSFIIPPDKKQKQIVKELNELSEKTKELEVIFGRKIADLEELKKSYLEQAFSGKM